MKKNFGIVLLAAGSSSRLGRPKQSLIFNGKTLLQNSITVATASDASSVIVVLGAHAEVLQKEIPSAGFRAVFNERWEEGMASSFACGVSAVLEEDAGVFGIVAMVCDQPYVTTDLINQLMIVHQNTGKLIVTCNYGSTFGPPSLFHKNLFPELMLLQGDVGAKSMINKYPGEVEMIPFPGGVTDVDTDSDYIKIIRGTSEQ